MKKNPIPRAGRLAALSFVFAWGMLPSAFSQAPAVPVCEDFSSPVLPTHWTPLFLQELSVKNPGPSGAATDYYLYAHDSSGASWTVGNVPSLRGNWMELLAGNKCLELCWDEILINDGDPNTIKTPAPRIYIEGPAGAAYFTASYTITDPGGPNPGWHTTCAPIRPLDATGNLPTSPNGTWTMVGGAPNTDWTLLLQNVTTIKFFADLHAAQTEEWGYDNICLRPAPCPDCMRITNQRIDCTPNAVGGYTYTLTFTVTNLSGQFAHVGLIPATATVPNNGSVTLSPNSVPLNLANGASGNVSVTINGALPGQKVCFNFVLMNFDLGECCRQEICQKMPCVKFQQDTVNCQPAVVGATYTPTLLNVSGATMEWIQFIPKTPGLAFSPSLVQAPNWLPNTAISLAPIQILGAAPNAEICFCVVLMDKDLRGCCIQEHCLRMPNCTTKAAPAPVVAQPAEPCKKDDPGTFLSQDGCLGICKERLICDPATVGTPNPCVIYSFTITNYGISPLDQLIFPHTGITPSSVNFSPPLATGAAASVTITICNVPPGPFVVPMVAVSLKDCRCCNLKRPVTLPNCDCMQVMNQTIKCAGIVNGVWCYTWTATIMNLETWQPAHVFLVPVNPANATFTPQYFSITPVPQFGTYTISTTIKAPGNPPSITLQITQHTLDFGTCCSIPFTINLPKCCECERSYVFENPVGAATPLPPEITLVNLERDALGKVAFTPTIKPFPYVYMAASNRGTMVRIDANTNTILGEYWTAPQAVRVALGNVTPNPSRTTVDRFGECWIGNRSDIIISNNAPKGTVMRLGLVIGGTRGIKVAGNFVANPAGEYLQGPFTYVSPSVVDRDGDGLIRTSNGLGNILNWDAANIGLNNGGGVSLADDECIVNYTRVVPIGVRALAIDANNDLWVGGTGGAFVYGSSGAYQKVSGVTGAAGITRPLLGGYGCVIDSNNVLWSVLVGNSIYRHDITANTTTTLPAQGIYGIGLDLCNGSVWTSSYIQGVEPAFGITSASYVLRRWNPAGTLTGAWAQPMAAQGLSVDSNGHPWVSKVNGGGGQVWHYNSSGMLLATIIGTNNGSTGTAVDHQGKIWVSDYVGNKATKIDPGTNTQVASVSMNAGAGPYNYSDMTGYVALGASGQFGMLQFTHDSLCPNTDWGRVTWLTQGENAALGCSIRVEVRASNNALVFPATWTPVSSGKIFCGTGITGRYIQVRVIFIRPAGCPPLCNPKLCRIRVQCCDKQQPDMLNLPPAVSNPGIITVRPGEAVRFSILAFDPENAPMTATLQGSGPSFPLPVVNNVVDYSLNLPAGTHAMAVAVSDGVNTTTESFSIVVRNAPPTIIPPPSVTVRAFSAALPNFVPQTVVSDDITPAAQIIVTQSPPPGQIVTMGPGIIVTLTARDGSGQTSSAVTQFMVDSVVGVGGVVKYQFYPVGQVVSPFPVLAPGTTAADVATTRLIVDGQVRATSAGLMAAAPLDLPPGPHEIAFEVVNAAGVASRSEVYPFGYMSANSPALILDPDANGQIVLRFNVPVGVTCCVQHSRDLLSWTTIHTVLGSGAEVSFPVVPDGPKGFYRLQYQ
jgi:hypothetical protein